MEKAEIYNFALCEERHENIDEEFEKVWKRFNGTDKKLWAIIMLLIANLGTLIGMLLKFH